MIYDAGLVRSINVANPVSSTENKLLWLSMATNYNFGAPPPDAASLCVQSGDRYATNLFNLLGLFGSKSVGPRSCHFYKL